MLTRAQARFQEHLTRHTTKGRVRLVRKTTPPMPWEPLVPTLLTLMCTAMEGRLQTEWRDNVSHFMSACIGLCKESRAMVMGHASAKYILFYERWRCHHPCPADCSAYFLEMWPRFVPLDGPFCGTAVSDVAAVRRLDVRAAVADRVSCVSTLEQEGTNLEIVRTRFYAPDLPKDVPLSVKIFVGRARFMYNAIKSEYLGDEDLFAGCRVCGRLCFFRQPSLDGSDDEEDEHCVIAPPLGSVESQREYWRLCGGRQPQLEHQSLQFQCCSSGCKCKVQYEVNIAMGINSQELLMFDAPPHKEGAGRVPAALRAALQRNELTGRRMRATGDYPYKVLTGEEVTQFRFMACTMLNVDLALLNAAAYISESPALIAGRVVPPLTRDWRSVPTLCRSAVVACRQFYNAYRPVEMIPVSSVVIRPKFLSKSRDQASTFF
jgi:hypothetical protein